MKFNYQIEKWSAVLPELRLFFNLLWEDVAVDKSYFTARCDEEKYNSLEKLDMLCVVTVRLDMRLVGYYVALITKNPHYLGAGLMALTDMYYVLPEFRNSGCGVKMFLFAEEAFRSLGCVKWYASHKIHRNRAKLFEELGFTSTDIIYSKVLL